MTIKAEVVREEQNPAVRLHRVMIELKQQAGAKQRAALQTLLDVQCKEPASFYARLAELHSLPKQVRMALARAQAHEQFLEWAGPIEAALERLSGSRTEKLDSFAAVDGLDEAITKLYMCIPLLDGHDSFALTELARVREALTSVLETVASAEIDAALRDWLISRMDEMNSVLRTAETVGVDAARERLYTLVGRTRFEPCPQPGSDRGLELLKRAAHIVTAVASLVNAGANAADVLGLLRD